MFTLICIKQLLLCMSWQTHLFAFALHMDIIKICWFRGSWLLVECCCSLLTLIQSETSLCASWGCRTFRLPWFYSGGRKLGKLATPLSQSPKPAGQFLEVVPRHIISHMASLSLPASVMEFQRGHLQSALLLQARVTNSLRSL